MHKQANTPSEQPHWHSCSHYSQQGVFGWRRRMKNGKRNYCISSGWGLGAGGGWECVRKPFTHNKFCKAIDLRYDSLTSLLTVLMQFACNLLSSAPMSNFQMCLVCWFIFYLFVCPLLSLTRSGSAMTPEPFSHSQKQPTTASHEQTSTVTDCYVYVCVLHSPMGLFLSTFRSSHDKME